jgi:hypothetical protein
MSELYAMFDEDEDESDTVAGDVVDDFVLLSLGNLLHPSHT